MNTGVRVRRGGDGEIVVMAAWCPKCRQESMPVRGRCSWCDTEIVDEESLPVRDLLEQLNNQEETPMTEARTCKFDGCDEAAVTSGPPFGAVCASHLAEAKREHGARTHSSGNGNGGETYADRLRATIAAARRLDKAEKQLAKVGAPEDVKAELAEAMRRANAVPNEENLARLEAASKAVRRGAGGRAKAEQEHTAAKLALRSALTPIARDLSAS